MTKQYRAFQFQLPTRANDADFVAQDGGGVKHGELSGRVEIYSFGWRAAKSMSARAYEGKGGQETPWGASNSTARVVS